MAPRDSRGGCSSSAPALRERNFGVLEGLTWDQIRQRCGELYERYRRRQDFAPPGGETARQRHGRAIACVSRIAADHAGRRVVLVTHGGVLMSMFKHAVGLDYQAPRNFSLYNASLNVFYVCDGRWHVAIWGDVTHLPGADLWDKY